MWVAEVRWAGSVHAKIVEGEGPQMMRRCFNAVQALADYPGVPTNPGFTAAANRVGDELVALDFPKWTNPQRVDPMVWTAPPLEVRVYHDPNARPDPPPATCTVYEARLRDARLDAGETDVEPVPPPPVPTGGFGAAIARLFGGRLG